jgi:hypothetical protein
MLEGKDLSLKRVSYKEKEECSRGKFLHSAKFAQHVLAVTEANLTQRGAAPLALNPQTISLEPGNTVPTRT